MQERRNSIANVLELRLFCAKRSMHRCAVHMYLRLEHEGVMTWKRFPHHYPVVTDGFLSQRTSNARVWCFIWKVTSPNILLIKQSNDAHMVSLKWHTSSCYSHTEFENTTISRYQTKFENTTISRYQTNQYDVAFWDLISSGVATFVDARNTAYHFDITL